MLVSASLAVGFASTAFAATTACRQWTTYDTMTKFDSNVWTIETGSQNQLDYSKGFLNMSVSESSQNVVLSTKNTFLPPASFEVTFMPSSTEGIVSPLIFKPSGDKTDEIDIEFTGYQPKDLQSVLWKDGTRIQYDIAEVSGLDPMSGFHTYKLEWTDTKVTISVNGKVVRTHTKNSNSWPSSAMPFKIGPWAYSDSDGWAGPLNWSKNPKAYNAIKDVTVTGCRPS